MSLFGGASATQGTTSMFGTPNAGSQPQQQPARSLFGNGAAQNNQQQSAPSLFGMSNPTQQQPTSLFGGSAQQPQQQQQQSTPMFGSTSIQQQPTSLFGASTQQSGPSLFGSALQQPQPQQQQQQASGGFSFGGSIQNQQEMGRASTFRTSHPQAQHLQLGQSLGQSSRPPLWQAGTGSFPREKTIPDQMQTLLEKWSPESGSCVFQYYFYNTVAPEIVPYYIPGPGEDEQKWEEALAKKPSEGSVPVLCKGFAALGNRLQIQVQSASALQARLHEVNNSLTAMLQEHDLNISVRTMDAKRRHVALSQRCLQLATKVQILRNRGYAMDKAEEELKTKLVELERTSFDPQLNGRQEEIWARLVAIRERARFLREELDKSSTGLPDSQAETMDADIMRRTKKILGDYDLQISHLRKEVDAIAGDLSLWESSQELGKS